jgi:putative transposase
VGNWKSFFKLQLALMVLGLLASVNYSYFLWWDATFAPKVAVEGLPSIISAYHSYFVYTSKLNGYLEQLTDYYWPLGQPGFIVPSYAPLSAVSVYGGLYRFTKYTCGCVSGCTPRGNTGRLFEVLKSYSLRHERGDELFPLLKAYRDAVNRVLEELWNNIEWEKRKIPGKKQWRLLPKYKVDVHSGKYKKKLRESLLEDWDYAAHWVDSAIKTAYSIFKSWRKNYVRGDRKRNKPTARRLFVRAKQTLIKLEGEKLRVTIKPGEHVYLDLSKRYFKLPSEVSSAGLGEPVITLEKVHLPVHYEDTQSGKPAVAWDFNLLSLDGYSPETGWVRIDTKKLASVHISSFEKRRSVQRKASKSKKAKRILAKYSKRERNRARKHQLEIARVIQSVAGVVGLEELKKQGMYTRSRLWNRRISRSDWRSITRILVGRMGEAGVKELDSYGSSSYCSVWVGEQRPEWGSFRV